MTIQQDEHGCYCDECKKYLPPTGLGCECKPVAPVVTTGPRPTYKPEPEPPKPERVREAKIYTPGPPPGRNPIVVLLEALNEKMGEAVDLLKILVKDK
jgi:hypothetical protein